MEALTWVLIALLAAVTVRRLALLCGALLPPRPVEGSAEPAVLVAVAARNEAWQVEPLLQSLDRLDYPAAKLFFVLASDGSGDGTAELFRRWCRGRPQARTLELAESAGKAAVLNAALAAGPPAELLAVYDADQRPRPDSLRKLARAFGDPRLAAAAGLRWPSNADRGIVSRYAALETWVHQLIVLAGKDRWQWNPPTMGGNCLYRRAAVEELGGFPDRACSEDIEVSLGLVSRGWRTRFVRDAVAESRVGETLRHFTSQRLRWTYGMYGAGKHARSLEAFAVASGYADRLIFAAAGAAALAGAMSPGWLAAYLSAPFLEVLAALAKAGRLRQAPAYLLGAVPMFLFDIACAAYATVRAVAGRRPSWQQPAGAAPDLSRSRRGG